MLWAGAFVAGCGGSPTEITSSSSGQCPVAAATLELPQLPEPAGCFRYGWTKQLSGSGTLAAVASDGTIAALSLQDGVRQVTVLDRMGQQLGSFPIEPYGDLLRIFPGGEVVAATRTGQLARFDMRGTALAKLDFGHPIEDLAATPSGLLLVSWQGEGGAAGLSEHGVVAAFSRDGTLHWSTTIEYETAPALAVSPDGSLLATGRATSALGSLTAFSILLDLNGQEVTRHTLSVSAAHPAGPLFVRSAFMGRVALQELSAWPNAGSWPATVDVDPSDSVSELTLHSNAPDFLTASDLAGASCWARSFRPLDESNHARLVSFAANARGAVIDVNGDVYKVHHIMRLSAAGTVRWRYDRPNDGMMNDVLLAGIDARDLVVLSGRFEGTQDFDPGPAIDARTATVESRRYITALFDCDHD